MRKPNQSWGDSLKHILHVEYDDQEGRVNVTHVPTAYLILFGMLTFLSKAFSADFNANSSTSERGAIAGPDGRP